MKLPLLRNRVRDGLRTQRGTFFGRKPLYAAMYHGGAHCVAGARGVDYGAGLRGNDAAALFIRPVDALFGEVDKHTLDALL